MTNTIIKAMAILAVTGILTLGQPTTSGAELTDAQMEEFLLNAEVVGSRGIGVGINQTRRLTLLDGDMEHDAQFNDVDEYRPEFESDRGRREINFRDTYRYNIAAYKLDRMIGLNMVPVAVRRKVSGSTGAVVWWVDTMMMESERVAKNIQAPDPSDWNNQMQQVRVFYELVYNTDARNLDNVLISPDWNIRLVDFTRAFRLYRNLKTPENLGRVDRRIYEGLKGLTEERLREEMDGSLTRPEIRGVLARRDKIIEFFDQQIEEKGEAAVFSDQPGH